MPVTPSEICAQTVVVLCHPQDVRNVGSAVRAVANFGLGALRVVSDFDFDEADLHNFSSFSLDAITYERCDSLEQALADRKRILGTSRRSRDPNAPPSWPAAELPQRLVPPAPTAILFGNERTGLTREEVDRCQALIHIPTNERFESMNLSHAVAVIAYELARPQNCAPRAIAPILRAPEPAIEGFYAHVHAVSEAMGYPPGRNADVFTRKMRKILTRANPDSAELSMLAGLMSELLRLHRLAYPQLHTPKPENDAPDQR